jgi:hypothetical protein
MQSLKLLNGDLMFENGELVIIDGAGELAQCCEIVLGTNKGEWFLNEEMGIDFNKMHGKNVNEQAIRQQIRNGLSQETRIKSVDDITVILDNVKRVSTVTFVATSDDGMSVESEVKI